MTMTSLSTLTSVATVVGAVFGTSKLIYILQLMWTYLKPSTLSRYAHPTSGNPPWALVTGSTGGIGGELSRELAHRGFNIVLHGRSPAKLEALKSKLVQEYPHREFRILEIDAGGPAAFGNTTELEEIKANLEDINLTVVVNNAGGATDRTMSTIDRLSSQRILYDANVNALFPMQLIRLTIPILQRNAPGLIINVGSLGEIGILVCGSYSASKMFLSRLSEVVDAEMELSNRDIEVLCVKVANVYGTGQTITDRPGLLAPDAKTMAKAVLARVGCGSPSIVGYWAHAVQYEALKLLPEFMKRRFLLDIARGLLTEESKAK